MVTVKRVFTGICFLFLFHQSYAQIKEFDQLEMYYAQGHYNLVLRKANHLLDKPEYDFSKLPTYYQSLAILQLNQNERWRKKHPESLDRAVKNILDIKGSLDGHRIVNSHLYELIYLKRDLSSWAEDLKKNNEQKMFERVLLIIKQIFGDIQEMDNIKEPANTQTQIALENSSASEQRKAMIKYAQKQLGVPYVFGGTDPKGFDCSGFTSYVFKEFKVELPRRAIDQYKSAEKIKEKQAQKGDLIFFDNGGGISHVGIVVSDIGESIEFIHASSSQGIVITKLESSDYWKKRLFGFGTYLK